MRADIIITRVSLYICLWVYINISKIISRLATFSLRCANVYHMWLYYIDLSLFLFLYFISAEVIFYLNVLVSTINIILLDTCCVVYNITSKQKKNEIAINTIIEYYTLNSTPYESMRECTKCFDQVSPNLG